MHDFAIRGGTIIDGTGASRFRGDIGITGDRITAVGNLTEPARAVIDAAGHIVAPGFIDIHTHYDAQLFWDPKLTPSSWYGITTVVSGNCGFGLAPVRPEDAETLCQVLAGAEGMDLQALRVGVPWGRYETFSEYLEVLDAVPKQLNMGLLVGHTTLRLYAMGKAAMDRTATPGELDTMASLLRDMLSTCAMGFSTSREAVHRTSDGRPVPSLAASMDEVMRLCDVVGGSGSGVIEFSPGNPRADTALSNKVMCEIASRTGRPVTWAALLTEHFSPEQIQTVLDEISVSSGRVLPQIGCRPLMFQISLEDPYAFNNIPAFEPVVKGDLPTRKKLYADARWRAQAGPEIERIRGGTFWQRTIVQESSVHASLINGPTIAELAERSGRPPFDEMVHLASQEDYKTRFGAILANNDEKGVGELLLNDRCLLGIADAGAHANQLCDASYPTDLLGHWCRELQVLSLEKAIWRLAGHPAEVYGITHRGTLKPGHFADIVVFDPETISHGPLQRVADFPAGAERLVAPSMGIQSVWVNGVRISGAEGGNAFPGRLLRSGR